jgi:hypothetical protein
MSKFALVDLKGGLGNQIFQISFANYLKNLGFNVLLDTTFFYSNHKFPRKLEVDLRELGFKKTKLKSNFIFRLNKSLFWEDDSFEIEDLKFYNRFVGYYQNFIYLENSKFFLKDKLNLISNNQNNDVAALHMRRTDYKIINQMLSDTYYEKAINELLINNNDLQFDIFTDDLNVKLDKKIFKNIRNIYKPMPNENSIDILRKMLNYKYYITANSSFSSIAAFLSEIDDKIVIYPDPWWRNSEIKLINIPVDWIGIQNI